MSVWIWHPADVEATNDSPGFAPGLTEGALAKREALGAKQALDDRWFLDEHGQLRKHDAVGAWTKLSNDALQHIVFLDLPSERDRRPIVATVHDQSRYGPQSGIHLGQCRLPTDGEWRWLYRRSDALLQSFAAQLARDVRQCTDALDASPVRDRKEWAAPDFSLDAPLEGIVTFAEGVERVGQLDASREDVYWRMMSHVDVIAQVLAVHLDLPLPGPDGYSYVEMEDRAMYERVVHRPAEISRHHWWPRAREIQPVRIVHVRTEERFKLLGERLPSGYVNQVQQDPKTLRGGKTL
jgi:hypothetical protein